MFLYWNGYEIDGSDTDFDIILPENNQMVDFVNCFFSIPLYDQELEADIYGNSTLRVKYTKEQLFENLSNGNYSQITIQINCKPMDELSKDIKEKIFTISQRRDPLEKSYGKVQTPCSDPIRQKNYTRGEKTVELTIQKPNEGFKWMDADRVDGYVNHPELFYLEANFPHISIKVGPGFYYEYAMYIMDYLCENFPEIGTCGGLDCSGGWTDGCTYADSIYALEKIQFPLKYGVKNCLKRLTEYDIVRSYNEYYKRGFKKEWLSTFRLVNEQRIQKQDWKRRRTKKDTDCLLSFSEYVTDVENQLNTDENDPFALTCNTAIYIQLPDESIFKEKKEVFEKLVDILADTELEKTRRNYNGYFAFTKVDNQPMYEFRISWYMKPYLMMLLQLAELGEIDFIKSVTYERRQNEE